MNGISQCVPYWMALVDKLGDKFCKVLIWLDAGIDHCYCDGRYRVLWITRPVAACRACYDVGI